MNIKLEGLEHKLVKHGGSHIFNRQLLHERVLFSGHKTKLKNDNLAESSIIRRVELVSVLTLVNNRIRQHSEKVELTECKRQNKKFQQF